jgi:DNA (cytosine-5)-methyltransferase 1
VLDAKVVVPQHRERIYMVGFRDKNLDFNFPDIKDEKPAMKDILEKNVPEKYTLTNHLWNYLQKYAEKHRAKGNGFGYGLVSLDSYSRTLSARYHKDGSEILIPQKNKNPRKLTPRECARLQGFPDTFIIPVSDTQAYRQFGNAVAVPIIESVAKEMIKTLTEKPERKTPYTIQQKMEFMLGA